MAEYRCDQCGGLPGEPCGDCPPNYHPRSNDLDAVKDYWAPLSEPGTPPPNALLTPGDEPRTANDPNQ